MRTQDEIVKRLNEVNDLFGTQQSDLVCYLDFEHAKPFLIEGLVAAVESGKEAWKQSADPKSDILDYLPFAYQKAQDERGLSAARSLLHLKTWIWLDDQAFYDEVIDLIENYTNYGLPALDKIAEHYGYVEA